MFIDRAKIFIRSGKGGDGCVSFRREKYVPKGGPDGGDGGDGGSVIFVVSKELNTLLDFSGRHHRYAGDGRPGTSRQCHGANGDDLVVSLPIGTLIYDDETGELISDLDQAGERLVVVRGGKGGYGNEHFKSPTNQTPRQATPGKPREQKTIRLELKLIADVGLVGMPNAGKSTLLSAVSQAKPKIADYPFTTREPQLGISEMSDFRRLIIADIPGLIEGAARGRGLGIEFLRHVERTRLLLHLIECEPVDGGDPVQNYHKIREELAAYSPLLAAKPEILVLSKTDLLGGTAERPNAVQRMKHQLGIEPFPISAVSGSGLRELLELCWKKVKQS